MPTKWIINERQRDHEDRQLWLLVRDRQDHRDEDGREDHLEDERVDVGHGETRRVLSGRHGGLVERRGNGGLIDEQQDHQRCSQSPDHLGRDVADRRHPIHALVDPGGQRDGRVEMRARDVAEQRHARHQGEAEAERDDKQGREALEPRPDDRQRAQSDEHEGADSLGGKRADVHQPSLGSSRAFVARRGRITRAARGHSA